MNLRRLIIAAIIMAFIVCAWYGAEMLIHGESQRSAVDITVMILISLSLSSKLEKEMEKNEERREFARKFAEGFTKYAKERTQKDGKNGSKQ